jgi:hypothetical protein
VPLPRYNRAGERTVDRVRRKFIKDGLEELEEVFERFPRCRVVTLGESIGPGPPMERYPDEEFPGRLPVFMRLARVFTEMA